MAFGRFRSIEGSAGHFKATLVPLELVQNFKVKNPIPITITANTFVVAASISNPVFLWNGQDFIKLTTTLTYTWLAATNNTLDSTGAAATQTGSTVGVWYYYIGINGSNVIVIRASQTAPVYAETPYQDGYYGHPGTSKAQHWTYVGFNIMRAATVAASGEKVGYWYQFSHFPSTTLFRRFPATAWSSTLVPNFVTVAPKHGVECAGFVKLPKQGSGAIRISTATTVTQAIRSGLKLTRQINSTGTTAALSRPSLFAAVSIPFGPWPLRPGSAKIWAACFSAASPALKVTTATVFGKPTSIAFGATTSDKPHIILNRFRDVV